MSLGLNLKLGEAHVLFGCPAVDNERMTLNITAYKALAMEQGLLTYLEILAFFLGGDGAAPAVLLERGRKMGVLLECWLTSVHEP